MTEYVDSSDDQAVELIENLLTEFGDNWQSVRELLSLNDGETKLSVLRQHVPNLDIEAATRSDILSALQNQYWNKLYFNRIESPLVIEAILRAVFYLGPQEAIKEVQQYLGVKFADGVMGKQTLRAIKKHSPEEFSTGFTRKFVERVSDNQRSKATAEFNAKADEDKNKSNVEAVEELENDNSSQVQIDFESVWPYIDKLELPESKSDALFKEMDKYRRIASQQQGGLSEDKVREANNFFHEVADSTTASAESKDVFWQAMNNWMEQLKGAEYTRKERKPKKPEQPKKPPPPPAPEFSIDAIAKKSTSDIWTIKDQLGYESYAHAIAKLIIENKAEPPLTISIQAPWGQGKTSLMRMIKHKLEYGLEAEKTTSKDSNSDTDNDVPGTQATLNNLDEWIDGETESASQTGGMIDSKQGTAPCVWFNPLYFQNSKQIWAGLAHTILHQLTEQLDNQLERERFWFRLRLTRINTRAIRRDIHKLILERLLPKGLAWFALLAVVLGLQLASNISASQLFNSYLFINGPLAAAGPIHLLISWFRKHNDWALDDKLAKYINEPDYEGDLGLLHLIEHDLDRALKLLLGSEQRLVVFIDDLDRCTPNTVNEILLAINQFISVQHRKIYFILGMDTHMVAMAIETAADKQAEAYNSNRHRSKRYGWRFMEKFVQLPFFIPRISHDDAQRFLQDLLKTGDMPEEESAELKKLKEKIDQSDDLTEVQDLVIQFKSDHNIEFVPDLNVKVADKMIDFTTKDNSETLKKLIKAALTDLELNPREMKRFLNVARLLFTRIDGTEDVNSNEHMLKVVRASHIVLNWPQCLRWLQGNARSHTLDGERINPVESIEKIISEDQQGNFESWKKALTKKWGDNVANTIGQIDFYLFVRRIMQDKPSLSDIFKAKLF